ncbi:MAG: AarF/ABC1/UbiB kinase family protein [Anaerolineales bacterium]|jgi:ubiquinone biosynthesis protein
MLRHFRRARNLKRYHKIVSVLARHGFGSILVNLQIDRYLPLPPRIFKQTARPPTLTPAEHLRIALEELGPTFIKLGQILSIRPDLFPPQYILELSKLREQVPATPWEEIHALLKKEYGDSLKNSFKQIETEPLGSASLAQVHAAVLVDGYPVVLKIQRPNIRQVITADLDILTDLAGLAQHTSWGKLYDPIKIVDQFAFTLQNELDFQREGINADRFRKNFRDEAHLRIPEIYWEFSTPHVLVMERIGGIGIDCLDELERSGYDRKEIANLAARIFIKEVMHDGFFHADPHPGNFVIMPQNGGSGLSKEGTAHAASGEDAPDLLIGAMDFGMVGYISQVDRVNLIHAYMLASRMDTRGLVEMMVRIGAVHPGVNESDLQRNLERILNRYQGLPIREIQAQQVFEELLQIAFRFRVDLPVDIWLLIKTVTMMDGLVRQLDPDFNIFAVFDPEVRRLAVEQYLPWVWGPDFVSDLQGFANALRSIPAVGEKFLRSMQKGELPFTVSMGADKETLNRLDRASTRLSLSLLVAAFILGLALLLPLSSGNQLAEILIVIGFVAAILLGFWLAISIIRSSF